jgi:hypothetical protein
VIATNNLFGNPLANFDRAQAQHGFGVSMLVEERQQDVFYLCLRVYCPAMLDPPLQNVPVRLDGQETRSLEHGGSMTEAEGILGRDTAITVGRVLHAKVAHGLANVFDLFREKTT